MKKKKILIAIIILLIVAVAAGVIAYLYLATDTFKSDKELFAKYAKQIVEDDGFFPSTLQDYKTKKETVAYENSGSISIDTELTSSTTDSSLQEAQALLGYANNTEITFTGSVDKSNSLAEENFQINYTDSVNLPFTYKRSGDTYGLLISDVTGESYVAVDNSNLPVLLQSFGATDVTNVPQTLDMVTIDDFILTDEEKTYISSTYSYIYEEISEDKFSKVENTDGTTSYVLSLTGEEFKSVLSQMLGTLSTDTTMIDKANEIISKINDMINTYVTVGSALFNIEEMTSEDILELQSELEETTFSGTVNITVTQSNSETNKLAIEILADDEETTTEDYTTDTTDETTSDSNSILIELSKVQTDTSNMVYTLSFEYATSAANFYVTTDLGFTNLNTDNPTEDLVITFGNNSSTKSILTYENNLTFGTDVTIEDFDESTTYILNNYSSTVVLPFVSEYIEKLEEINTEQMTQIGFSTDEISNPLTLWIEGPFLTLVSSFSTSDSTTDTTDLGTGTITTDTEDDEIIAVSTADVTAFNEQFAQYEGTLTGTDVKTFISLVKAVNAIAADDTEKVQVLTEVGDSTVDEDSINVSATEDDYLDQVSDWAVSTSSYTISFAYDSTTGRITTAYIVEADTETETEDTTTNTTSSGNITMVNAITTD